MASGLCGRRGFSAHNHAMEDEEVSGVVQKGRFVVQVIPMDLFIHPTFPLESSPALSPIQLAPEVLATQHSTQDLLARALSPKPVVFPHLGGGGGGGGGRRRVSTATNFYP